MQIADPDMLRIVLFILRHFRIIFRRLISRILIGLNVQVLSSQDYLII